MFEKPAKRGRWWFVVVPVVIVIGIFAAFIVVRKPALQIDDPGVRISKPPEEIAGFSLQDDDGNPFTREQLLGEWTLIFTGFLYCPDICPTTLSDMAAVFKKLEQSKEGLAGFRLVFISVDPFRDTPDLIKEYVDYFYPGFIGATGDPEELKKLAERFNLFYAYTDADTNELIVNVLQRPEPEYYNVIHATTILVVSPQAEIVARLSPPFETNRVATELQKIRNYYGD